MHRFAAFRFLTLSALALMTLGDYQVAMATQGDDVAEEASLEGGEAQADVVQENANPTETAPIDTGGKGLSFLQLLTRGGWFMLPLGLLSIAVVTIGIERFLALRKEKLFPQQLVRQISVLSHSPGGLDPRQLYQICQKHPSSASYIIRSMLTRVGRPQSEIENAVNEASQREVSRLSSLASWLTLAAAIAPLIGLLGTVWGITQAFYDTTQLVAGQNRAEALAQGIYTALVTTMTGLMIAIPAATLAHFFENRIIAVVNEIEEMIYSLLPQFERYEGQLRFTTGPDLENGSSNTAGTRAAGTESTPSSEAPSPRKRKKTAR